MVTSVATAAAAPVVTPAIPAVVAGQPFQMRPGGRVRLPGGELLQFVAVLDDSRCPPGVTCIWAGQATVQFRANDSADLSIVLSPAVGEGQVGTTRLRVLGLEPRSGAVQSKDAVVSLVADVPDSGSR